MPGIDQIIRDTAQTFASQPEKLAQRYAQNKDLLDLLALQKVQQEKQAAARNLQATMQTQPATVKNQLEQENLAVAKQEIAAGLPQIPAPNMTAVGRARGGIIGYAGGGMPGQPQSQVGTRPTPGFTSPRAADPEDIKRLAILYQQASAAVQAAQTPQEKAIRTKQLQDLITQMGSQHPYVMQYIDSTKGSVDSQAIQGGMNNYAPGGSVGRAYIDPETGEPMRLGERLSKLARILLGMGSREGSDRGLGSLVEKERKPLQQRLREARAESRANLPEAYDQRVTRERRERAEEALKQMQPQPPAPQATVPTRAEAFSAMFPDAQAAVDQYAADKAKGGLGYLQRIGRMQDERAADNLRKMRYIAMLNKNQNILDAIDPAQGGINNYAPGGSVGRAYLDPETGEPLGARDRISRLIRGLFGGLDEDELYKNPNAMSPEELLNFPSEAEIRRASHNVPEAERLSPQELNALTFEEGRQRLIDRAMQRRNQPPPAAEPAPAPEPEPDGPFMGPPTAAEAFSAMFPNAQAAVDRYAAQKNAPQAAPQAAQQAAPKSRWEEELDRLTKQSENPYTQLSQALGGFARGAGRGVGMGLLGASQGLGDYKKGIDAQRMALIQQIRNDEISKQEFDIKNRELNAAEERNRIQEKYYDAMSAAQTARSENDLMEIASDYAISVTEDPNFRGALTTRIENSMEAKGKTAAEKAAMVQNALAEERNKTMNEFLQRVRGGMNSELQSLLDKYATQSGQ